MADYSSNGMAENCPQYDDMPVSIKESPYNRNGDAVKSSGKRVTESRTNLSAGAENTRAC